MKENFKVGDKVRLEKSGEIMEVYEATNPFTGKYLALRSASGGMTFNGAISFYEEGFYGGRPIKLNGNN